VYSKIVQMTLPAKKQATKDAIAEEVGAGSAGRGYVKRVRDVIVLTACQGQLRYARRSTHESVNCKSERIPRKVAIGPQTRGTTNHFVRVRPYHKSALPLSLCRVFVGPNAVPTTSARKHQSSLCETITHLEDIPLEQSSTLFQVPRVVHLTQVVLLGPCAIPHLLEQRL
jgi:hypothetical protein